MQSEPTLQSQPEALGVAVTLGNPLPHMASRFPPPQAMSTFWHDPAPPMQSNEQVPPPQLRVTSLQALLVTTQLMRQA